MTTPPTNRAEAPKVITAGAGPRETSWAATHEALWPVIERALKSGPLPIIGTCEWLALAPSDPRRVGAIHSAAEQWALHLENHATAMIEASHETSGALPWGDLGRAEASRIAWLEANPWAKRVVA